MQQEIERRNMKEEIKHLDTLSQCIIATKKKPPKTMEKKERNYNHNLPEVKIWNWMISIRLKTMEGAK